MSKNPKILLNFPLGLLIGSVLAFGVSAIIDAKVGETLVNRYLPPLLTAAATLTSASLAIAGVRWNIQNQNELSQIARDRKLAAARASLPLALSELVEVCDRHIAHHSNNTDRVAPGSESLSETAQATFKAVIENATDKTQESLSFLLLAYQVMLSRYYSRQSEAKDAIHTEDGSKLARYKHASSIVHWASLKALASVQFSYARTRNEAADEDRARKIFEFEVKGCRTYEGWVLSNDEIYRKYFEMAIEDPHSGFFKPNYFER